MGTKQKSSRERRVRARIFGTALRPRLSIYKSNMGMQAQIINDEQGKTIVGVSSTKLSKKAKMTKEAQAGELGKELAEKAKKAKVTKVVFDRGSYRYQGRVAAFAKAAREGGLDF